MRRRKKPGINTRKMIESENPDYYGGDKKEDRASVEEGREATDRDSITCILLQLTL